MRVKSWRKTQLPVPWPRNSLSTRISCNYAIVASAFSSSPQTPLPSRTTFLTCPRPSKSVTAKSDASPAKKNGRRCRLNAASLTARRNRGPRECWSSKATKCPTSSTISLRSISQNRAFPTCFSAWSIIEMSTVCEHDAGPGEQRPAASTSTHFSATFH